LNKLNIYAVFGIVFLSSMLLGNGIYSNQIFAQNENEAEIEADIEQENKCKKDTECENENEINNRLNITTITGAGAANGDGNGGPNPVEDGTCAFCFTTTNLDPAGPWPPGKLTQFVEFIEDPENTVPFLGDDDVDSLQEICDALDAASTPIDYQAIQDLIDDSLNGNNDQLVSEVVACLEDAGYDIGPPP